MTAPQPNTDEIIAMLSQRIGDLTAQLAVAQSVLNAYAKRDQPQTEEPN